MILIGCAIHGLQRNLIAHTVTNFDALFIDTSAMKLTPSAAADRRQLLEIGYNDAIRAVRLLQY